MSDNFLLIIEGLHEFREYFREAANIEFAAVQAINKTARDARAAAQKQILAEIAFPSSYLNPAQKRLYIAAQARRGSLEARIVARGRPTSLSRFVTSEPTKQRPGVRLQVSPGHTTYMKRGFLIKLRAGTDSVETRFNQGLAIRLKPGEQIKNKKITTARLSKNLYVLYGPSVSQAFLREAGEQKGVAVDLTPGILDQLEGEMLRLFEGRKKNG